MIYSIYIYIFNIIYIYLIYIYLIYIYIIYMYLIYIIYIFIFLKYFEKIRELWNVLIQNLGKRFWTFSHVYCMHPSMGSTFDGGNRPKKTSRRVAGGDPKNFPFRKREQLAYRFVEKKSGKKTLWLKVGFFTKKGSEGSLHVHIPFFSRTKTKKGGCPALKVTGGFESRFDYIFDPWIGFSENHGIPCLLLKHKLPPIP